MSVMFETTTGVPLVSVTGETVPSSTSTHIFRRLGVLTIVRVVIEVSPFLDGGPHEAPGAEYLGFPSFEPALAFLTCWHPGEFTLFEHNDSFLNGSGPGAKRRALRACPRPRSTHSVTHL